MGVQRGRDPTRHATHYGRRRHTTAHSGACGRLDILSLEIRELLQIIDIAYARGLFEAHGNHIEATDLEFML